MSNDGGNQDKAPPATSVPAPAPGGSDRPPPAWLPLTPRGVAAFATAPFSRLFTVQLIFAGASAAAVVWFAATVWAPILRQAIRQLPEQGALRDGRLDLPVTHVPAAQPNRFLVLTVDLENRREPELATDLHIKFR